MKKRAKLLICLITVLMLSLTCLCTTIFAATNTSLKNPSEIFSVDDTTMTVRSNQKIPQIPGMQYTDESRGVLVSTKKNGAKAMLSGEMSGEFSTEFRVYSSVTSEKDFERLYMEFTDLDSGRNFTVFINQAGWGYHGYGFANVIPDGVTQGHAFVKDSVLGEDGILRGEGEHNDNAIFHTTSFCNTVDAGYSQPISVRFNPSTMEVMLMTQNSWYVLMDLDKPSHIAAAAVPGGVYAGFNRYSVAFRFEDVFTGKTAKMLALSLNGQKLSGTSFTNTAGPSLSANPINRGVINYDYTLPKAYAYDVIDGQVGYNGTPIVTGPLGQAMTVTNGKFRPTSVGTYTVTYPKGGAVDKGGMEAEDDIMISLQIIEEKPVTEIQVQGIRDMKLALGSAVKFPIATYKNELSLQKNTFLPIKLTLKNQEDSKTIFEIVDMKEEKTHAFSESGVYIARYETTDVLGQIKSKEYTVEISSDVPRFMVDAFSSVVARNREFIIPRATAVVGTKSLEVSAKLIFPNGVIHDVDRAVLDIVGKYTIEYSATNEGMTYTYNTYFDVLTKPSSLFENVKGTAITDNYDAPSYMTDWDNKSTYNGVKIVADRNNAQFKYSNVINLLDNSKNDVLFEYLIIPSTQLKPDFNTIEFKFTDIYDPQNTLTILLTRCGDRDYDYIALAKAAAKNNPPAGVLWGGQVSTSPYNGTNTTTNFIGRPYAGKEVAHSGKFYFDNETKVISAGYNAGQQEVIDLDNPKHVGTGNEWRGFTTGEVTLTVTMQDVISPTATMMILNVDGQPLNGEYISSSVKPLFSVNYKGNTKAPEGLTGKKYPVFDVRVNDPIDGVVPFTTKVFYMYDQEGEQEFAIANDNTFTPTHVGTYTILYQTAAVNFPVEVEVKATLTPLGYEFSTVPKGTASVGEAIIIPRGIATGGSGDGKKISIKAYKKATQKEISIYNNSFIVKDQGKFLIKIEVEDYLGQTYSYSYEIKSTYSKTPVIVNPPFIPSAMKKNAQYTLPILEAKDYYSVKGEEKDTRVTISVTDKNGITKVLGEDRKYTPTEMGRITVKYKATSKLDATCFVEKSYDIAVIDANFKSEYFYSNDEFLMGDTEEYGEFRTFTEGGAMQFSNSLYAGDFILSFQIPAELATYGRMDIILTDSENANISVVFSFFKTAQENTPVAINGERTGVMVGLFGDSTRSYRFKYNDNERKIFNADNVCAGTVTKTIGGKDFNGFTSGKVYMTMTFNELDANAMGGVQIRGLNGQNFDDLGGDLRAPNLVLNKELVSSAGYGEKIQVSYATAYDVLDPYAYTKVSVIGPGGVTVIAERLLEHGMSFVADKYGSYSVIYRTFDSSNNSSRYVYNIAVTDDIPPTIEVIGSMPTSGKVGKQVVLPEIKLSDNSMTALTLYSYYIMPSGKMLTIYDGKFTPTEKGRYEIWLYTKDASNSYTSRKYVFMVE